MMGRRENQVERRLATLVKEDGGECLKWVSPGYNNVPDRICLYPCGVVLFVEAKCVKEKARPGQIRELEKLYSLGHHAAVVAGEFQVNEMISAWRAWRKQAHRKNEVFRWGF